MMMNASIRAALLDDASHERLGLGAWLDELAGDLREGNPA
jgi:hypothetical protein